jgi:hypothetical protein
MLITTGKVSGDSIRIDGEPLPEGATVTILVPEDGGVFALDPDDEAKLLAAIGEAERGETISASTILDEIRKS